MAVFCEEGMMRESENFWGRNEREVFNWGILRHWRMWRAEKFFRAMVLTWVGVVMLRVLLMDVVG